MIWMMKEKKTMMVLLITVMMMLMIVVTDDANVPALLIPMALINAFVSLFKPVPVLINAFFVGRVIFWWVVTPVC